MSFNGQDEARAQTLRRKARADVRALRRAAAAKREEVQRKGRQDIKTARRRIRDTDARDVASAAAERAELLDPQTPGGDSDDEMADRARGMVDLRAPMAASLDPGPEPRALESFVTAAPVEPAGDDRGSDPDGRDERDRDPAPPPLAAGIGFGFAPPGQQPAGSVAVVDDEQDRDARGSLEFDDPFGLAGGGPLE